MCCSPLFLININKYVEVATLGNKVVWSPIVYELSTIEAFSNCHQRGWYKLDSEKAAFYQLHFAHRRIRKVPLYLWTIAMSSEIERIHTNK